VIRLGLGSLDSVIRIGQLLSCLACFAVVEAFVTQLPVTSIDFGIICREELFMASCCREESIVVRICQKQACALLGWFLGSNEGLQILKEIFLRQCYLRRNRAMCASHFQHLLCFLHCFS
jgi:hypothetical protein